MTAAAYQPAATPQRTVLPRRPGAAAIATRLQTWRPGLSDRALGWLLPLLITAIAFVLRLRDVSNVYNVAKGTPSGQIFDEVYYANDAWSLLHHGVEGFEPHSGIRAVHPPLGKWMMAASEAVFGLTPLGWRFSSVVCGSLIVLVTARLGRRLTRSTLLGTLAGLLVSLDGLEFAQSRLGILDIFLCFWLVCAAACLAADRDSGRARLAARVAAGASTAWPGPNLGIRWWRLAAGVSLGAACAVKWSGLPYIPLAILVAVCGDAGARRALGVRAPWRAALWRDWGGYGVALLLVPTVVYTASWTGWFVTGKGYQYDYHRTATATSTVANGGGVVSDLRAWWHFHDDTLCFHENLENDPHTSPARCGGGYDESSHHPYESKPFGWLVLGRPVALAYDTVQAGQSENGHVCTATGGSTCARAVLDVGTPALWWGGLLAVIGCAAAFVARRDWRAGFVVALFAAGFVPWLSNTERVMFLFYALPLVPVYAVAVAVVSGWAFGGGASATPLRRGVAAGAVGAFTLLVLGDFAWLYPVIDGQVIPYHSWAERTITGFGFPGWL